MKKKNFIIMLFLGVSITSIPFFGVSLMANEKESSTETISINNKEVSPEYLNDLSDRTADLGQNIINNLNGTNFKLDNIILRAEKYPTQVIYIQSIKETTSKEKQNAKNTILKMIESENFSEKETFEIVFKEI
ncbi:hypothetical protein [Pseudalkalibacillus hwajinpoensis]|uniref:Uncharacterized protein n=1 Tax=Guptibacillus hwajinpoensis TaxID=208199 RepID=A0A4U1MH61_9BACL|nr:hypothetical protein [Pseudalkalibacillus hwajinpoensis]TKD69784.1 hypothetical protein FBF83_10885 [Pseudalkalibacillus hwajinpoensis]